MRVPYEWLREFVDITVTPEEVADRLTMIGLEVEAVESVKGDTVFEINVTPNRPDCLGIIGIAREVSAAFKTPLRIPAHEIKEELPLSDFSVEILSPELCNRYTGRVIKDVRISDSPDWIKTRLEKCGIRAINNIVDITNYLLLEFGHPLHAFDADTIRPCIVIPAKAGIQSGKKIRIGTPNIIAGQGVKIVTLDGIERELPEDALLIWDSIRPVAIAGIMGGLETEVSYKTKNIFLESAYFEPFSIRRTSKRLNLVSESSYRFERGTDIEFLEGALNRAALMIREIAGGIIHEIIDVYPVKYVPVPIEIRYERINRILGTDLSNMDMLEILNRLGIKTEDKEDVFIVYPPAFRRD
ncbi:MAG: phenylalanine--tRNA ligase subunit beta, partial [Nitrospirota bacterium]